MLNKRIRWYYIFLGKPPPTSRVVVIERRQMTGTCSTDVKEAFLPEFYGPAKAIIEMTARIQLDGLKEEDVTKELIFRCRHWPRPLFGWHVKEKDPFIQQTMLKDKAVNKARWKQSIKNVLAGNEQHLGKLMMTTIVQNATTSAIRHI